MNKNTMIWVLGLVVLVAAVSWLVVTPGKPGKLDAFASCIAEEEAIFYGAFWCPHCQNQKAMFGRSARLLPYVECSPANGQGQLQVCTDAGVAGYPTWVFADGTVETGEISLERLSELTNCSLPENNE
jgi:hypothetical protein